MTDKIKTLMLASTMGLLAGGTLQPTRQNVSLPPEERRFDALGPSDLSKLQAAAAKRTRRAQARAGEASDEE